MNEPIRIKSSEARKIISQLNRMDLDRADYELIKKLINDLTLGLPMNGIIPHPDSRLYRGVVYKEKPLKPCFLGAPPKHIVTDFQRCNQPLNPMFYCSVDPCSIYYELDVKPGDKLYLSKWSVTGDFIINRIAPIDDHEIDDLVRDIVLTFFETKFAQPIHDTYSSQYKITSAIAEKLALGELIGDPRPLGAITYPSVANPRRSENLAIKADLVEKCLRLDYVEEILITEIKNKDISITRTDFSSDFTGDSINWAGKPLHWNLSSGQKLVVTAEHDGWVARDESGKLVNPG